MAARSRETTARNPLGAEGTTDTDRRAQATRAWAWTRQMLQGIPYVRVVQRRHRGFHRIKCGQGDCGRMHHCEPGGARNVEMRDTPCRYAHVAIVHMTEDRTEGLLKVHRSILETLQIYGELYGEQRELLQKLQTDLTRVYDLVKSFT